MCQDQRLLQLAGVGTLCRAASVCSSPPPSHFHQLIENIIGASKCPCKSSTSIRLWLCSYNLNTCYLADTDLVS